MKKVKVSEEEQRLINNEKRRKKYAADSEYREHAKVQQRENYRKKQKMTECTHSAVTATSKLRKIGLERVVDGESQTTFNVIEFGEAMGGYTRQVIAKWLKDEMIPEMDHVGAIAGMDNRSRSKVFTLEETQAMARIMKEHQNIFCYYAKSHLDIREQLFEAVEAIR